MSESAEVVEARAELDAAVKRWLKVKANEEVDDDGDEDELLRTPDPISLGWVLVAVYTSVELEQADATGYSYECPDGQIAALSRGLAMAGVDRWSNH